MQADSESRKGVKLNSPEVTPGVGPGAEAANGIRGKEFD